MKTEIITLNYNSNSEKSKKKSVESSSPNLLKEGEAYYDSEYVARVRKAEKEPFVDVDLSEYGIEL